MRGDLDLIVKQQSVTGLEVKLTFMGSWSVPTILFWGRETALPCPPLLASASDYFGVGRIASQIG